MTESSSYNEDNPSSRNPSRAVDTLFRKVCLIRTVSVIHHAIISASAEIIEYRNDSEKDTIFHRLEQRQLSKLA